MALTVANGRLPMIVTPNHYDLFYRHIDLKNFTFKGSVTLYLQTAETLSDHKASIVLHTHELHLMEATLNFMGSSEKEKGCWKAIEFRYQINHQTCEIIFDIGETEESIWVASQPYELTIDFQGILNDQMAGLYRSSYTNLQGSQTVMATTQFEPTDARRAFPCFDEPALKATFQLRVHLPAHLQAISNTPIVSKTTHDLDSSTGTMTKTVTFGKTPKMSTYLLALVVGEFDSISCTSPQTNIQTTVYAVPGKAEKGQFCLDTATRSLDFLQDIFGVPYPLIKSDLIAIPDFAAGAMENWGCVTYREAKILVTKESSEAIRRGIARTVAHELSHMWFGNLVTPEWWQQLWLKEGVARFMEFATLDHLFPEWNIWDEFTQSVYGLALSLDSLESSHPVEVSVTHSDEINEIFDAISYAKGASIIRMLSNFIGMDNFMKGMQLYLTRHAYSNAVSEDFWRAMSEASGVPMLVEFMYTWTTVTGFPILQLHTIENGDKLSMTTDRFYAGGTKSGNQANTAVKWSMPVTARVEGSDAIQGPWVINGPDKDESEVLLQQMQIWSSEEKWFKLNVDQNNFYHVCYTPEQWRRLARVMEPSGPLSISDRLGLISDSFSAGKAGYLSIVDSLRLVEGFASHETGEYAVWQELSSNLSSLASLYRSEKCYPKLQNYIRNIYKKQAEQLGWEPAPTDGARTGSLRATVLHMMGIANDSTIIREAYCRFMTIAKADASSSDGVSLLSGDIRRVLFRLALRHDEAIVYATLKRLFEQQGSLSPEIQRDCLVVMGNVQDPKFHSEMLDYTVFSGKVRQQDLAFPLSTLSGSSDAGGHATWKFFCEHYDELESKLGSVTWRSCVGACASGLRTIQEAQQVEDFFKERSAGSAERRLQQALEVIRTQAARIQRDRGALDTFFSER